MGNALKLKETLSDITLKDIEEMAAVFISNGHAAEEYEDILKTLLDDAATRIAVYSGINSKYKCDVFNLLLFIKLRGRPKFYITGELVDEDTGV